jgi:membrane associated rhomboid family serine protease
MNQEDSQRFRLPGACRVPLLLLVALVALHLAGNVGLIGPASDWANIPRTWAGLDGILLSHLRHASWGHLAANAVPLILLPSLAGSLMPQATRRAWWLIPPLAGSLLWLVGRPAAHVGASALVYGWFFFLLGTALFQRSWRAALGALIALFAFGGLVFVFRGDAGISWDGHATGAAAGAWTAWILRPRARGAAIRPEL